MNLIRPFLCILLLSGFITSSFAQISLTDVAPGKVATAAFDLKDSGKIKITGTGGVFMDDWQIIAFYGWILNSETRDVVWRMGDKLIKNDIDFGEIEINDEVTLSGGSYELYFTAAYVQWNGDRSWYGNVKNGVNYVFSSGSRYNRGIQRDMTIAVSGNLAATNFKDIITKKTADAIVSIQRPDHNANIKKGFSLSAETKLHIYATGEARKREVFDFAWIYDVDKAKRVWEMDYYSADFAGGDDKNILFDKEIKLPAGNYLVTYITDDSHGYNDWNVMPPDDPQFSGITIWADAQDKKNVIPFKAPEQIKPVVEITKVGDDEFISKGMTIKSPVDLRIMCMGEEGSSTRMADGGWIINALTREVVWDANREFKKHAGGADKNQVSEGTIRLDAGDYIVYYASDDSHSYGDWNSGPPHEQDYWGITLWVTKKEDISKISEFNPAQYKSKNVIAEILQVRDNENRSETFTLAQDTRLRIVALGEGSGGDMSDFGWIKNTSTGRIVWDMTYRSTTHGGGSSKNRLFNDVVILPKGEYKVFYETDDSHSYRDWNASPPNDQEQYGISLYTEK